VGRWEKQVDGFRLVTVVLVVSYRLLSLSFEWDINTDSRASERAVFVFLPPYLVGAVGFERSAEIPVWLDLLLIWLSGDAPAGVPVEVLSLLAIGVV